ncbi:MAG: hypothetical protein M1815_005241 [Lichina confinis]|nr:MAG: hypothetical protein M1815_005241 [Lichina confinis]
MLGSYRAPVEILETATGNAALTLFLARAIQAANMPPPALPGTYWFQNGEARKRYPREKVTGPELASHGSPLETAEGFQARAFEMWRAQRNAIVHSVGSKSAVSQRAQGLVRNFRRGLYYPHVDFHVSKVGDWIAAQKAARAEGSRECNPWLSHAVLNMDNPENDLTAICEALLHEGRLLVWSSNITDIARCVSEIVKLRLPLDHGPVIEVGGHSKLGGRGWVVAPTRPRQASDPPSAGAGARRQTRSRRKTMSKSRSSAIDASEEDMLEGSYSPNGRDDVTGDVDGDDVGEPNDETVDDTTSKAFPRMVCRPDRSMALRDGGFIGYWVKRDLR